MTNRKVLSLALSLLLVAATAIAQNMPTGGTDPRPRVLISTDIGGTDPDDNQSMAHLLMYNELFQLEGLVSSPSYGDGSVSEIHRMIDLYALDMPKLAAHVSGLYSPDFLHSITKQGRHGSVPYQGFAESTEGSEWIISCARKQSDKPLWVLVWGCLDDVAQALHDAPDIADKIRVVWIGGPNKKWGVNGYHYIVKNFPSLWMIENNSSYYGFLANPKIDSVFHAGYYDAFIKGAGHLGADFINYYKGVPKMGDTPTLFYMMDGNPNDPEGESWGGSFEKITHSAHDSYAHPMAATDTVRTYTLLEIHFKGPKQRMKTGTECFQLKIDNQMWPGYYVGKGDYVCIYCPKQPASLTYESTSSIKQLDGLKGAFTVKRVWPGEKTALDYPLGSNWYSDRAAEDLAQGKWPGFKTTLKWRERALADWAVRWSWLK